MKQRSSESLFFTGALSLAAVWLLFGTGWMCSPAALKAVGAQQADFCLEYWLARYQTLLGGVATLAGAAWVVLTTREQTALTRAQLARAKVDEFDKRLSATQRGRKLLVDLVPWMVAATSTEVDALMELNQTRTWTSKDLSRIDAAFERLKSAQDEFHAHVTMLFNISTEIGDADLVNVVGAFANNARWWRANFDTTVARYGYFRRADTEERIHRAMNGAPVPLRVRESLIAYHGQLSRLIVAKEAEATVRLGDAKERLAEMEKALA